MAVSPLLIGGIILVVLIIGVGAFYFYNKRKQEQEMLMMAEAMQEQRRLIDDGMGEYNGDEEDVGDEEDTDTVLEDTDTVQEEDTDTVQEEDIDTVQEEDTDTVPEDTDTVPEDSQVDGTDVWGYDSLNNIVKCIATPDCEQVTLDQTRIADFKTKCEGAGHSVLECGQCGPFLCSGSIPIDLDLEGPLPGGDRRYEGGVTVIESTEAAVLSAENAVLAAQLAQSLQDLEEAQKAAKKARKDAQAAKAAADSAVAAAAQLPPSADTTENVQNAQDAADTAQDAATNAEQTVDMLKKGGDFLHKTCKWAEIPQQRCSMAQLCTRLSIVQSKCSKMLVQSRVDLCKQNQLKGRYCNRRALRPLLGDPLPHWCDRVGIRADCTRNRVCKRLGLPDDCKNRQINRSLAMCNKLRLWEHDCNKDNLRGKIVKTEQKISKVLSDQCKRMGIRQARCDSDRVNEMLLKCQEYDIGPTQCTKQRLQAKRGKGKAKGKARGKGQN